MSSHAVEGTRLVDRYRLDKQLGEAAGTTYWRAHDELLDRAVGLCLLPAGNEHAERVLHAAFAGQRPAPAAEDVVEVLLTVWLRTIYGRVGGD